MKVSDPRGKTRNSDEKNTSKKENLEKKFMAFAQKKILMGGNEVYCFCRVRSLSKGSYLPRSSSIFIIDGLIDGNVKKERKKKATESKILVIIGNIFKDSHAKT